LSTIDDHTNSDDWDLSGISSRHFHPSLGIETGTAFPRWGGGCFKGLVAKPDC